MIATESKIILRCSSCSHLIRLPRISKKIRINCPKCNHSFEYQNRFWKLSIENKYLLVMGVIGTWIGIFLSENLYEMLFKDRWLNFSSFFIITIYMVSISTFMSVSEGYLKKNINHFTYGLIWGVALGIISGIASHFIANGVFTYFSSSLQEGIYNDQQVLQLIAIRSLSWGILGLLFGFILGVKENTLGDVLFGALGGLIGGGVGGLFFDAIAYWTMDDTFSRAFSFFILGSSLSLSLAYTRDIAIRKQSKLMYQRLTHRIPKNLRLEIH